MASTASSMIRISVMSGTLPMVTLSPVMTDAAIMGRAAFFAPEMVTSP